ncbi:MAG TPA: hypothetical protein VEX86_14075 [Longimicrobium sp.]|nr:hypothetical protein [Longimicrobium sp.]
MPLRKIIPLIAAALTLAACSSDSITGPASQRTPPRLDGTGGGMLGGGGVVRPDLSGGGMLGGGG